MTKKRKYLEQAKELYVKKQLTLGEIAKKLPVGYSTLRNWKASEGWDEKRKDVMVAAQAFHKELYELGREISKAIREDMRNGIEVQPARYYALGRIMDMVDKTYKYEEKVRNLEKSKGNKKVKLEDILKTLNDQLFDSPEE